MKPNIVVFAILGAIALVCAAGVILLSYTGHIDDATRAGFFAVVSTVVGVGGGVLISSKDTEG